MASYTASETGDDALFRKLKKQFRADREYSAAWRKMAREDFDFVAGEQWSEEEKAYLKAQVRPIITMNRTMTIINAVSGQEMGNKQEVRYVGREPGDMKPNELLTEASRWFREQAEADDEDSEAFLHTTICGMGWTETTLDYSDEENGSPKEDVRDPLKMFWDKAARKHNLVDRKRQWYVEPMSIADAKEKFPGADVAELDAAWAKPDSEEGETKDQDRERLYQDDGSGGDAEIDDDKTVTIVHCEYVEQEKSYRVVDPFSGQKSDMSVSDYKTYTKRAKELGMPVHSTQMSKRVVRQCFLGGKILDKDDGLAGPHFRYQCVTGFKDQNKGTFFGLVRQLKDPQKWANKWLSQALEIMNTQSKGGVMIEADTVEDMREFERTWARQDKPTIVPPGTLSNPNGSKIMPKPAGAFPQGFYQLMEFATNSVRDISGVSPEMMGMTDREQPASLEYQRRQAGMMILQPLFKNLKRYRHEHGKLMLYIIQNYLSDGRLVRIIGKDGAQFVPLMKQADAKYDIVIDDMPTSPNQKEMVWAMVGQDFFKLPPEMQKVFLKYSPFPTSVQDDFEETMKAAGNDPMQEIKQRLAMMEVQLKDKEAGLTEAKTELTHVQAMQTMKDAQQPPSDPNQAIMVDYAKLQGLQQIQREKQAGDMQLAHRKQQGDFALKQSDQMFTQQLKERESLNNMALAHRQAASQAEINRQKASQKPLYGRAG